MDGWSICLVQGGYLRREWLVHSCLVRIYYARQLVLVRSEQLCASVIVMGGIFCQLICSLE